MDVWIKIIVMTFSAPSVIRHVLCFFLFFPFRGGSASPGYEIKGRHVYRFLW